MKKNVYVALTIIILAFCLTACSNKDKKEIQEVENYLSEISDYEIKIENSDDTTKNGMIMIDSSYRCIHPNYRKISKIYNDSDQQELILSTIKKYISKDWFNGYLEYVNNNEYFDTSEISEDIFKIYE